MGLRDALRVATHPEQAAREVQRWREQIREHRAPEPGEVVELNPSTGRWHPIEGRR